MNNIVENTIHELAAVTVLYNPKKINISYINSYIDIVGKMIVVDNSDEEISDVINELKNMKKVVYISMNGNKGIAAALNRGFREVLHYKYVLTMDQDSCITEPMKMKLLKQFKEVVNSYDDVAVFSLNNDERRFKGDTNIYVDEVMTSGNIIDVGKIRKLGFFEDKLFIDGVDDDLCYRALKFGYKVIVIQGISIHHELGEPKVLNLGINKIKFITHSPIRDYYAVRNLLYVIQKYSDYRCTNIKRLLKIIVKAFFVETEKRTRVRYIFFALYDYLHNKYGQCEH